MEREPPPLRTVYVLTPWPGGEGAALSSVLSSSGREVWVLKVGQNREKIDNKCMPDSRIPRMAMYPV